MLAPVVLGPLVAALSRALLNEKVIVRFLDILEPAIGRANGRQLEEMRELLRVELDPIRAELRRLDDLVEQLDRRLGNVERRVWRDNGDWPPDMAT